MDDFKQFGQPLVEMVLFHGLKVPFRVILRFIFHLEAGVGSLLKLVNERYGCLVEAGTKQVGLAFSGYGNSVFRIFFSLMLIVQEQVAQFAKTYPRC